MSGGNISIGYVLAPSPRSPDGYLIVLLRRSTVARHVHVSSLLSSTLRFPYLMLTIRAAEQSQPPPLARPQCLE